MLQSDREVVQLFWSSIVAFFWLFTTTGTLFVAFHWSWPRLRSQYYQDKAENIANVLGRVAIIAFGMMILASAAACWFSTTALKDPVVWVGAGR